MGFCFPLLGHYTQMIKNSFIATYYLQTDVRRTNRVQLISTLYGNIQHKQQTNSSKQLNKQSLKNIYNVWKSLNTFSVKDSSAMLLCTQTDVKELHQTWYEVLLMVG